jgi:heme A synthase
MPDQEYNSRKYGSELTHRLVAGAIILTLLVGTGFVYIRLGEGPLFLAMATFAVVGLVILLVVMVLKVIEWLGGSDE